MYKLTDAYFHPSKWIVSIQVSNINQDGDRICAVSYYLKPKTDRILRTCFFIESADEVEALIEADSVGSHYLKFWADGAARWYWGEDDDSFNNINTGNPQELKEVIMEQEGVEDIIEDLESHPEKKKEIDFSKALDFLENVNNINGLILNEELSLMEGFALTIKDVEDIFGFNLKKRVYYNLLNKVGTGNIANPANWVKMKYEFKNFYDVLDKDGFTGLSQVGKRYLESHNPLIRNRQVYLAQKAINKGKALGWTGKKQQQALSKVYKDPKHINRQINIFNKQNERLGLKYDNLKLIKDYNKHLLIGTKEQWIREHSRQLEKVYEGDKLIGVRWTQKHLSTPRKFVNITKKTTRLMRGLLKFML